MLKEVLKHGVLVLFSLAFSLSAFAESDPTGKFYMGPVFQKQWVDKGRGEALVSGVEAVSDMELPGFLFGYFVTDQVSAELLIANDEFDLASTGREKSSSTQFNLVGWGRSGKTWQPYWTVGMGRVKVERPNIDTHNDTRFNFGVGVITDLKTDYSWTDGLRVRADLRRFYGLNNDDLDNSLTVGLQWMLGRDKTQARPTRTRESREETRAQRPPADSDRDGVPNSRDNCQATPAGTKVDRFGCPRTPKVKPEKKAKPDRKAKADKQPRPERRAAAPRDADGDGVMNARDACPNTPAGRKVDVQGCELDSDADGVKDHDDLCPDTPPGEATNSRGCPPPKAPVRFDLTVEFDLDKSEIRSAERQDLRRFIAFMRRYPKAVAVLEGHTDSTGTDAYNQALSVRRATAVRNYLLERSNLDPARLKTRGYGETRPVAGNNTDAGRQRNRRVAATVVVQPN